MSISITKKTSTTNTTAASGRTISYIVVHYTAGVTSKSGSAANTAAYFAKATTKASADFIVDDATIVQFNPDIANRYCWHCGGSKYSTKGGSMYGKITNKNSIGIEMCSTNSTGSVKSANDSTWSFTTATKNKAKALIQYLMDKYNIDADHVYRHYDVNGKLCPGIPGWNKDSGSESKWNTFKKAATKTTTTKLTVSGTLNKATVKRMQKWLGTTVDGVISDQPKAYKEYYVSYGSAAIEFKEKNSGGSAVVKALKKKIGHSDTTGYLGKSAIKTLQKYLGVSQTGKMGKKTVKALQRMLNKL